MKIGFAGRWDPQDKSSWSGTYYYTYQQLKKKHDVSIFLFRWTWLVREQLMLRRQFHKRLQGKHTSVEFLKSYATFFSRQLENELKKNKVDLLYAPAAPQLIAYLKTQAPIIFMTDATFKQIKGYYDSWQNIAPSNIREGIEVDSHAFHNAAHSLVASDWCRQSAISDYGIDPNKISVAPLGANLDLPPAKAIEKQNTGICQLLFLGVEWERKGGPIALETFRELRRMGLNAHLHIIGCRPPIELSDKNITVIPYLDKNKPAEQAQLVSVLQQTHFLLLPTRAECAGVVFCEAAAYGIPSISTATGGVPTYVRDGINGYAMPYHSTGAAYAETLASLFSDFSKYQALSHSSRKLYEEELNWDRWGERFMDAAKKVV
ncbi:glycosyltransferase family 4 protein [Flavisolibacter sp. BT320]|nr:glycosyltransferase family 4 protein [Flavisolibacter longurius]